MHVFLKECMHIMHVSWFSCVHACMHVVGIHIHKRRGVKTRGTHAHACREAAMRCGAATHCMPGWRMRGACPARFLGFLLATDAATTQHEDPRTLPAQIRVTVRRYIRTAPRSHARARVPAGLAGE